MGSNPTVGSREREHRFKNMKIKEILPNIKKKFIEQFGRFFFHDMLSITLMIVSGIILFILFAILIFRLKGTDALVPLFYNSIYGVTTSVMWYKLYFIPFSYLIITVLNIFIAWAFFERERLITYLLLFVTLIIGLILMIMEFNLTVLIRG